MSSVPDDLTGSTATAVSFAGKSYPVKPLTMSQARRLRDEFRKLPPPEVVPVDVQGLVEAMFRAGREDDAIQRLSGPLAAATLTGIRRDIQETVQQMVREARARLEQWPPQAHTPEGMQLILEDERLFAPAVSILLDVPPAEAEKLLEIAGQHEYAALVDAAYQAILDRLMEQQLRLLKDPKAQEVTRLTNDFLSGRRSGSGGDGVTSLLPPSNNVRASSS